MSPSIADARSVITVLLSVALADAVQVLTDETFDAAIQKNGKTFVKFYAPWCGHCTRMAPMWAELATTLQERTDGEVIHVAKVDATVEKVLSFRVSLSGFPTIALFAPDANGKLRAYKYNGPRDPTALESFASGEYLTTEPFTYYPYYLAKPIAILDETINKCQKHGIASCASSIVLGLVLAIALAIAIVWAIDGILWLKDLVLPPREAAAQETPPASAKPTKAKAA